MFISKVKSGLNVHKMSTAEGFFLFLFAHPKHNHLKPEIRACVRKIHLTDWGWMIGRLKIGKHTISVSGNFGNDNLPICSPSVREIWDKLTPVPESIQADYWHKKYEKLEAWAKRNVKKLRKRIV